MRRIILVFGIVLLLFAGSFPAYATTPPNKGLVAWWKFDQGSGKRALDSVNHQESNILNNFEWVPGVSGTALKFGGFTTVVKTDAKNTPHLGGSFTIEAWVALHEYPVNWVALVDQERNHHAGYFFGIDSQGRLGLQLEVWGDWEECTSSVRLPLMKWVHVVGVYNEHTGIKLYVDGKQAGALPVRGRMTPADETGMQIGRDFKALPPTNLVRQNVRFPALYSLDGIIDNIKIYDRAFTPQNVEQAYNSVKPMHPPALKPRHWPVIPDRPNAFGAVYTRLKLYPAWDALWRTGPDSDVVVRFKNKPYKYVFWRGTNFEENLVTGNNIWFGDQSFEGGTRDGCAEHMSDKKALHQYISILESNPARVVLHWRYALVDVEGHFADVDPLTGWGDWADEYFYIYPDGISVRYGTVHGPRQDYSFTEPTILLPPGKKAEDYISLDAVTISNMQGQIRTYSWSPKSPPFPFPNQPPKANIARVNLKSTYKPFYVYMPGTILGPYGNPPEIRPLYSHFPTWNHWPVNQAPSDGRFASFPDRYSSAAVMSPDPNKNWIYKPGPKQSTYFLFGLTDKPVSALASIARSWLHAPRLKVLTPGFESKGYFKPQRAYRLVRQHLGGRFGLKFELEASKASPVYDPAIVIMDWGPADASLKIDGKRVPLGPDFREGHIHRLGGTDLVVWIRREAMRTVTIALMPKKD